MHLQAVPLRVAGPVQVTYGIHTLRVELYETPADIVRGVLEGLLTVAVVAALALELWGVVNARLRKVKYLLSFSLCLSAH